MKEIISLTIKMSWSFILLFGLWSCSDSSDTEDQQWKLEWEDDFEGPQGQSPDASNWGYNVGTAWGNNQLEYDTDRPENISLDGEGNLSITARQENYLGTNYTSARITTQGKFETKYGKIEARIKMPFGAGIWPAFWMLGTDCVPLLNDDGSCCNGAEGWPDCGEIDIVELRGQEQTKMHGSIHGPGYSGGSPITRTKSITDSRFDTEYHIFSIEWTENKIDFFLDGEKYQGISSDDVPGQWVFNNDFYLILNVAVGGFFAGNPNSSTTFPQTMSVDYVRVYKAD